MKCLNNCRCSSIGSPYIKHTLEILGPVILGSKPAEILNISAKDKKKEDKIKDINDFFCNCVRLSYNIILMADESYRILFYNKESLDNVFTKKSINFLKFLGYPNEYELNSYVDFLLKRIKESDFPHEIGIFLGYPLKDVLGFMGYGNYEFAKTKYWKVYGDESVSDMIYNKFISDRIKFKELMENTSISELKSII